MADVAENQDENSLRLTDNELQEIKTKAKWLRRACQPFHELETIISVGLESQATTQHLIEPGTREYITDLPDWVRALRVEDANTINTHLPLIATCLSAPTTTPEKVTFIANKIQHVANGAKDWDTKHMKTDVLNLIPEKYLPDTDAGSVIVRRVPASFIEITEPEASKIWRGLNHIVTARLLCPAKYIEQFKRDPEGTRRSLKNRRLLLIDRESYPFFPVFLYDEDLMDGTATKGLFRGPLLVRVYRYIFLGRSQSHAVSARRGKKKGNAQLHGMHAVKPSTICYTTIQVYVALSSMTTWGMRDGEIDLSFLYDLLRRQLSNLNDPWVKETLQWWNDQVFPTVANDGDDLRNLQDTEGPSMREMMETERTARMSQAATGAANV